MPGPSHERSYYDKPQAPSTAIVSIGRNLGFEPMSDEHWAAFKSDLTDALAFTYADAIHFTGEGVGYFDGRSEQSFTVVFTERWPGNYSLEVLLKVLAARYGQESIALTRGETVFVEADEDTQFLSENF